MAQRKNGLLGVLAVLLVVCTAFSSFAALAVEQYVTGAVPTVDRYGIRYERLWRKVYWRMGWQFPDEPELEQLDARLAAKDFKLGQPMLIRIFKREFELEVWFKKSDGRFHLFETYPICRWSGHLGPKHKTGDKQAPEGFYTVSSGQLNPNSRWHRSFNLGYPNAYDRSHGRTGSYLMVHGGCSSIGCYAMTNRIVDEIWRIVKASLGNGQKRFQVQAYPFRMSARRMEAYAGHPSLPLWRQLKIGHDLFEESHVPPKAAVCSGSYVFAPGKSGSDGSDRIRRSCKIKTSRLGR